jgi:acyl-CoA thioesterase FadM
VVARPDGRVVCSAATRWALVNLATRRPMRIPADMAAALEPLERTGCTSPS